MATDLEIVQIIKEFQMSTVKMAREIAALRDELAIERRLSAERLSALPRNG